MTAHDILRHRLYNEQLTKPRFTNPEDVVSWLGAMQAQDYPGAKWALGQRLSEATDNSIEHAFTEGKILRTHVLRPTWHFVHPRDIRWMLELTGPRVSKAMATYNKQLELTDEVFKKAQNIFIKFLEGKKQLTRQELKTELDRAGIITNVQRLAHLVMQAELDGVIVSGPVRGKQFTYMLMDERVPNIKELNHDEALVTLTKRYFMSHGPAQIKDFVWWSGLTVVDAKKGLEMLGKEISKEVIAEKEYYFYPGSPPPISERVYLLPNYDEYTIAYKDRNAFYDKSSGISIYSMGALTYPHVITYQGKVIGTWRRELKKDSLIVIPNFPKKPSKNVLGKIEEAADRYGKFLSQKVELT